MTSGNFDYLVIGFLVGALCGVFESRLDKDRIREAVEEALENYGVLREPETDEPEELNY